MRAGQAGQTGHTGATGAGAQEAADGAGGEGGACGAGGGALAQPASSVTAQNSKNAERVGVCERMPLRKTCCAAAGRWYADGTKTDGTNMTWVLFEVFLAFGLAVFIVWWTLPRKRRRVETKPSDAPSGPAASVEDARDR